MNKYKKLSITNYEIAVTMVLTKRLMPVDLNANELEKIQKGVIDGDFLDKTISSLIENSINDNKEAIAFLAMNAYIISFAVELGQEIFYDKKVELPEIFKTKEINRNDYLEYLEATPDDSDANFMFETADVIKLANQEAVTILNDKDITKRIIQVYDVLLNKAKLEEKYSKIMEIINGIKVIKKQKHTGFILD